MAEKAAELFCGLFAFSGLNAYGSTMVLHMNSEDPDILIHPRKGKNERLLPERALLVVNPAEARCGIAEFEKHGPEKRFLYNSTLLVEQRRNVCLAGPCLGAPAAGLVMEKLVVLGVKEVLLFSCCGAIEPCLSIGDVLLATSAVSGEGVSKYYTSERCVEPGVQVTGSLRSFLHEAGMSWTEGAVWSTDAPYRESKRELAALQNDFGVCGVDMECSALCSIAAFRQVGFAALFVVSDELWGPEWRAGFKKPDYQDRSKSLLTKLIVHLLQENPDSNENI